MPARDLGCNRAPMARSSTTFEKGDVGNPRGRPAKTDAERAGEMYLRERTEEAAERLCQLQKSSDEKIALGATIAHLKITLGTLERKAGANGEDPVIDELRRATLEQLLELVRSGK